MSALDGSHRTVRGLTIATHGHRCREIVDVMGSLHKGGPEKCPQLVAHSTCRVFGQLQRSASPSPRGITDLLRAEGCLGLALDGGELGVGSGRDG